MGYPYKKQRILIKEYRNFYFLKKIQNFYSRSPWKNTLRKWKNYITGCPWKNNCKQNTIMAQRVFGERQ